MPARESTQKIEASLARDRARAAALLGDMVSRETWARLDRFVALLLKWQDTTNLVAPSTLAEIWTRHIADSLQLLRIVPDARAWITRRRPWSSAAGYRRRFPARPSYEHPGAAAAWCGAARSFA